MLARLRRHKAEWIAVAVAISPLLLVGQVMPMYAASAREMVARIEAPPHAGKLPMEDPLHRLLRSATVLAPCHHRNLTLFPVTTSAVADFGPVLTMDEALERGLLVIREAGLGAVNQVVAVNRSDRYVFMMASEMIRGAKQDRTLGEDVLMAPRSELRLPVFCVEASRWTPGASFEKAEGGATLGVRRTMRASQNQSEVWAKVAEEQVRLRAPSATGTLRSVYQSPTVQSCMEPYLSKLGSLPRAAPNVIGVVVASGDRILCADLFYHPSLFGRLWPKLLRSYAADAIGKPYAPGRVTLAEAERFLGRLYHAHRRTAASPGVGYALRLESDGVTASALIFKHLVVHLEAFPGIELLPLRQPDPGMNLQFRRQRLESQ